MATVWVQADLDALENALADGKGARSIQFSGQRVEFHSIPDMLALRAIIKREINTLTVRRYRFASVSKGV